MALLCCTGSSWILGTLLTLWGLCSWFHECFVNVMHPKVCVRLWEFIIMGAPAMVMFTGLSVLLRYRQDLFRIKERQELTDFLCRLPMHIDEDRAQTCLSSAIELWRKNGRPVLRQ
eukprot:m.182890 g.182890  ORF g.182890 m.182890 type:complete len:116 (+) comp10489_c0_seq14:779-1126(+)